MSTSTTTSRLPDELIASSDTEWLGAHVVSAACFCPRAAVISHRRGANDIGQDLDYAPPLDYLPNYDTKELEQALEQCWVEIGMAVIGIFLAFVITIVLAAAVDARFWFIFGAACIWASRNVYSRVVDIITLYRRLWASRDAQAALPIENYELPQLVNWWRLVKSGFTPVEYQDPHEDPQLRLAGRPWRVLHDGSLRIPVFRKSQGKAELGDQQIARVAAYCHLIETAEGGTSPYGVVLFGDDAHGMTVPNNPSNQQRFHQGLRDAREATRTASTAPLLVPTPPAQHCQQCPLGNPRRYRTTGARMTSSLPETAVFRTRAKDGHLYHSPCGDFFRWVPPHKRAAELELY